MKIYTKTGDKGTSSLADGTRVEKNHQRLIAYGGLDELNSFIGLSISSIRQSPFNELSQDASFLQEIQTHLFVIGSHIATEKEKVLTLLPQFNTEAITELETAMDNMNLPELSNFILPGGDAISSQLHICRSICRRVERDLIPISETIDTNFLIFINRLSDYFFCLARRVNIVSNCEEILWKSL